VLPGIGDSVTDQAPGVFPPLRLTLLARARCYFLAVQHRSGAKSRDMRRSLVVLLLVGFVLSSVKARAWELLLSDGDANKIDRISRSGHVSVFATGLNQPFGIALDRRGDLFVANYAGGPAGAGSIVEIRSSGRQTVVADKLTDPFGLAFDRKGYLYATMATDGLVQKYPPGAVFASGFHEPVAVAFGPDGSLYVSDHLGLSIARVDAQGNVTTFVSGLNYPNGMTFGPHGDLYVAIQDDNAIEKITPAGVVSIFASVSDPADVTYAPDGNLYAIGLFDTTVYKITPEGQVTPFASGFGDARFIIVWHPRSHHRAHHHWGRGER
jgi:sugar lactone lactonase YvrE